LIDPGSAASLDEPPLHGGDVPGKVLILRWGGSAYDSLGGLLELTGRELAADGFERLGAEVARGGYAFALTMSGIGTDFRMPDGRLLWEAVQVPMFNWCCDHPCYFPTRHVIRSSYLLHGYVFPDHADYNIRHLNPNGAAYAVHMGIPPRGIFGDVPLPLASRNGRIVFSKSGKNTNEIEEAWRRRMPLVRDILFEAAETLFHRNTADFLPGLQQAAERRGLHLSGNSDLAIALLLDLDAYVRFRRAEMLVRTLLRYPVDVYGRGWDHIGWDGASARLLGPAPWADMLRQLPQYLGCLSMNPLVDLSTHDRVFFALAAGVPASSDSNEFSRSHMPEMEPYAFAFTRERIEQAIDALLSDPQAALERSEATWQTLSERFSMRYSARQIVQFIGLRSGNVRTAN